MTLDSQINTLHCRIFVFLLTPKITKDIAFHRWSGYFDAICSFHMVLVTKCLRLIKLNILISTTLSIH